MLAWLAYLTVALVWGSTYFAIAVGLATFTPYGMVAARFSLAALLALGLGRWRREPWPPRRELYHLMVVGALLLGGSNALVSYAELHLASGLAAVLAALVPLWLAVLSMGKERLGPKGWLGLALGLVGVAVLVAPRGGLHMHAGGLAAMVAAPFILRHRPFPYRRRKRRRSRISLPLAMTSTSATSLRISKRTD